MSKMWQRSQRSRRWQKLATFLLTWLEPLKIVGVALLIVAFTKNSIVFFVLSAFIISTVRLTVETERQLTLEGGFVTYRPNQRGTLLKLNLCDWKFWLGITKL